MRGLSRVHAIGKHVLIATGNHAGTKQRRTCANTGAAWGGAVGQAVFARVGLHVIGQAQGVNRDDIDARTAQRVLQ